MLMAIYGAIRDEHAGRMQPHEASLSFPLQVTEMRINVPSVSSRLCQLTYSWAAERVGEEADASV